MRPYDVRKILKADFEDQSRRRVTVRINQGSQVPKRELCSTGVLGSSFATIDKGVTGIYARWHMFEEKRDAVIAIEAAVLPLMPEMAR